MSILRTMREAKKLTREQVAIATHISVFRLGRFERREQIPNMHEARALAKFFACSVEALGTAMDEEALVGTCEEAEHG